MEFQCQLSAAAGRAAVAELEASSAWHLTGAWRELAGAERTPWRVPRAFPCLAALAYYHASGALSNSMLVFGVVTGGPAFVRARHALVGRVVRARASGGPPRRRGRA